MSIAPILFSTLAALVVVLAAFAVFGRRHFASVIGFVAFGLLLALVWMILSAPDVALTEAAVGGGVTGALLLCACARWREIQGVPQPPIVLRIAAAGLCAAVTVGLIIVVLSLPSPPPTLATTAWDSLDVTGMGNAVTAVLMAFRALDTMLEKVVLLLALIAVWSFGRDCVWGGRPDLMFLPQKNGPLTFLAKILIPVGVLAGIYLFWVGADKPGGAFAGGALIAAMGLLAIFSGLIRPPSIENLRLRWALVLGILVFLGVGFLGFAMVGDFLAYPSALAKPIIVVIEIAMTLSIAFTLFMLVVGPAEKKP